MKTLILFDIDETLIKSLNDDKTTFSECFKKVYGIDSTIDIINYSDMTDQQIIIKVLKKKGLNKSQILSKINVCMEVMTEFFNNIKKSLKIKVFKGVPELLKELQNQNFIIGLVTGNIKPIANIKLKKLI